jgi:hypothetical protein
MNNAGTFWSSSANCPNSAVPAGCNGNGDGQILGTGSPSGQGDEHLRAWQHLSLAGVLNGSYSGIATVTNESDFGVNAPASKLGNAGYYFTYQQWGGYTTQPANNYIAIGGFHAGSDPVLNVLMPVDAYNLDVKLDDGIPQTGIVLGFGYSGSACMSGTGTASIYSLSNNLVTCMLGFSAS